MGQAILSVTVISISVLFSAIFCTLLDPAVYHFKVKRLERCDEEVNWNISINFLNFTVVKQDGHDAEFQGIIEIIKPIQINFRLSVHGLVCNGPEDRQCNHKFIRKFGYICPKLHQSDRPWYVFIKNKLTCPIPTGQYDMETVNLGINDLSQLPLYDGYWVLKVYGYQGSDVIMCVYSEMRIKVVSRSRKPHENITST